eukprot:g64381.t1
MAQQCPSPSHCDSCRWLLADIGSILDKTEVSSGVSLVWMWLGFRSVRLCPEFCKCWVTVSFMALPLHLLTLTEQYPAACFRYKNAERAFEKLMPRAIQRGLEHHGKMIDT